MDKAKRRTVTSAEVSGVFPIAACVRPAIRVDVAVAIAAPAVETSAPKLLATRASLTAAPVDSRDAFLISLVDGRTPFPAIVDASGMPDADVKAILERLACLGLVALTDLPREEADLPRLDARGATTARRNWGKHHLDGSRGAAMLLHCRQVTQP